MRVLVVGGTGVGKSTVLATLGRSLAGRDGSAEADGSATVVLNELHDLNDLHDLLDLHDLQPAKHQDDEEQDEEHQDEPEAVDLVLVVVDPRTESIEAGRRAVERAAAASLDVVVVANRITGEEDQEAIQEAFADEEVVVVPDDPALAEASSGDASSVDAPPHSPAVQPLAALAETLLPPGTPPTGSHRALPLAGMALALYAVVPAYAGPQVNVSSRVELVDHVLPGAVVLAVSAAALFLADAGRRTANLMLVGGLLTFLAGFWMTATHLPLVAQALRDEVPGVDAAYHSIPGFAVVVLGVAWAAAYWSETAPQDPPGQPAKEKDLDMETTEEAADQEATEQEEQRA